MEVKPSPISGAPRVIASPSSSGDFVELEGEVCYRISAFHRLEPFLMTLPGDTDLWMFIASGGGLTAGRVDPDGSLFPYVTVDQLHDAHHHTGPVTVIEMEQDGQRIRWQPFGVLEENDPRVERNLYKNTVGNRLVFEEIRRDLGLAFRYRWAASDEFGWVRTATLHNRGDVPVALSLVDGLRNVLPYGAPLLLLQQAGNLVDAYKKSEVDSDTGLGIFSLTSSITDRAEALEVLRANTVWCCGLEEPRVHLSSAALTAFRAGRRPAAEHLRNGGRGNYLVSAAFELGPDESSRWHLVGDTGLDHVRVVALRRRLQEPADLFDQVEKSLQQATDNLRRIVGSADGLQITGHAASRWHHFANVLFNNMRGGVFLANHEIPVSDLADFLGVRSRAVFRRQQDALSDLPPAVTVEKMRQVARDTADVDFERLVYEYLPLYFGRRHGDPSRPWNRFSIRARNRRGERELNFEGNWRDIFQNWEALATAFPGFLPNMVAKFVNASTVDGFNPYRVTRAGVDWEIVLPDDPWSNIGYWGDHQIVYLLRLLEAMDRHDPKALDDLMGRDVFSYVEVPYRIKPYRDLLRDPRATIDFDHELADRIERRVAELGTDGKLLADAHGEVVHANLLEKLLVPALSKVSNLIPDAGIWMNTQRPEWNDANNALVGGGVSVVTLCHLRRYLAFLADRLPVQAQPELPVATEVADWLSAIEAALAQGRARLPHLDARGRKHLMDALGGAFSTYREKVYAHGFSGRQDVPLQRVVHLCRLALEFVDAGIAANRRPDGLYHTYNLVRIEDDGVDIERLPEMLEGQVAVLSSGLLRPENAVDVLRELFGSDLYAPEPRSFLLYPKKELPGFLAKNMVPAPRVQAIPLLMDLLAVGNPAVVERDADGVVRFQGDLRNADDLEAALDRLAQRETLAQPVARDRQAILELFEEVFRHSSYTGRSGVMYGYEGIGCIYWHMVGKLLLAAQEHVLQAYREGLDAALCADLARMYYRIRSGLGFEKTVSEFGAFPTDPYSHTPPDGGAKQPGMTGQVKEEILTRMGELGVDVSGGVVRFSPRLLRSGEFLEQAERFEYFDTSGRARDLPLPAGALAFTFCQVPVVYEQVTTGPWIRVLFADGSSREIRGDLLDAETSRELFSRRGRIDGIRVGIPRDDLCRL